MSELIGISKRAKKILVARKQLTGKPFSKLIDEYVGIPELKSGRKGNFADVTEFIAVGIVIAIGLLVLFAVIGNFNSNIQSMDESVITNASKDIAQAGFDSLSWWDYLLPGLLLAFIGFSVVMARLIPSSPVFILTSLFALILLPFGGMLVEEFWFGWSSASAVSGYVSSLPLTNFLLSHLGVVLLVYSFLVAVALLTKDGGVGGA